MFYPPMVYVIFRIANAGAIKVLDPICFPSVRSAPFWLQKGIPFSVRVGAEYASCSHDALATRVFKVPRKKYVRGGAFRMGG
jgi:hypothetical protein